MKWLYLAGLVGLAVELAIIIYLLIIQRRRKPFFAVLRLFQKGRELQMPLTLSVGKTATAVLTEFDAAGAVVPPVSQPVYTSDNEAVATVAGNQVTAVAVGTANITGADSGDNISAADVLTVVDVAASGKLTLTAN